MILLNTKIWAQTVTAALLTVGEATAWGRAIKRAQREIEKTAYWSFAGGVLKLKSTTSGKLYEVTRTGHRCEATEKSGACCKHVCALRLIERYIERLEKEPYGENTTDKGQSCPREQIRCAACESAQVDSHANPQRQQMVRATVRKGGRTKQNHSFA